jgi:thiol-disulfide isomerase/thioredoxin
MPETFDYDRRQFLGGALLAGAAVGLGNSNLPVESPLPSLGGATKWLNSPPLSAAGLRGKVALASFWTYSCINWRRTLPYLRAWNQRYKHLGLTIIGVHTPEFPFERDAGNVRQAVSELGIEYPVAMDNGRGLWRAFRNEYWPALYFADAQGRIRHHYFGEGEYQQSELVIRQLLEEAGTSGIDPVPAPVDAEGVEAAADWANLRSPETYMGNDRATGFSSPIGLMPGDSPDYRFPARLTLNQWALEGAWTVAGQSIRLNESGGRIAYCFHARDLHLVMGSAFRGTSVRFQVRIDGRPPGTAHGVDVDEHGAGILAEPRLYQLIRQREPVVDRRFEIEFFGPGLEAFSFTFG